jgi:hypothetical protein
LENSHGIENVAMAEEMKKDPNILYGGDTDDLGPIDCGYRSLGGLLLADLRKGRARTAFVSRFLNFAIKLLNHPLPSSQRSMEPITEAGSIQTSSRIPAK